ncbi:hypothetical protein V9T40_006187 [Parthenolecanium corni]|uniref:RNA ligase domain-containing protein n=1 Tax=Parthenolecanium corni TaxID=536013 RepID=A0AAN9YA93_9HEMI
MSFEYPEIKTCYDREILQSIANMPSEWVCQEKVDGSNLALVISKTDENYRIGVLSRRKLLTTCSVSLVEIEWTDKKKKPKFLGFAQPERNKYHKVTKIDNNFKFMDLNQDNIHQITEVGVQVYDILEHLVGPNQKFVIYGEYWSPKVNKLEYGDRFFKIFDCGIEDEEIITFFSTEKYYSLLSTSNIDLVKILDIDRKDIYKNVVEDTIMYSFCPAIPIEGVVVKANDKDYIASERLTFKIKKWFVSHQSDEIIAAIQSAFTKLGVHPNSENIDEYMVECQKDNIPDTEELRETLLNFTDDTQVKN